MKKNAKWVKLTLLFSLSLALVVAGFSLSSLQGVSSELELKGPLFEENLEPHPIDPESFEGKIISAIKKVSPAVVSISTERTVTVSDFDRERLFGPPFEDFDEFFKKFFEQFPQKRSPRRGLGSGMIINENGYIITNSHVIEGVDEGKVTVTLSTNESYQAQIMEIDVESDIALLKIEGESFPYVVLGNSGNTQVGQWVIALGNPFGYALSELNKKYEPTVTVGVVSATGRAIQAGGSGGKSKIYGDLIQTDASINPGNSGGPLVNIYGEVIGINTAILSPTGGSVGIGFAIPIDKAKNLLQSLVKYGEIKWPWIGIYMQELSPELAEKFGVDKGVLVADVVSSSPADKAGIKPGDVIQQVNSDLVGTPLDLKEKVLKTTIGEKINLTLLRDGKEVIVELYTAPKPKEITEAKTEAVEAKEAVEEKLLGIKVEEITRELREQFKIKEEVKGVIITEVLPQSSADKGGISAGDVIDIIIKGADRKEIESLSDFEVVMIDIKSGDNLLLRIRHGSWPPMFVAIEAAG